MAKKEKKSSDKGKATTPKDAKSGKWVSKKASDKSKGKQQEKPSKGEGTDLTGPRRKK